jgi:hypothetical protein
LACKDARRRRFSTGAPRCARGVAHIVALRWRPSPELSAGGMTWHHAGTIERRPRLSYLPLRSTRATRAALTLPVVRAQAAQHSLARRPQQPPPPSRPQVRAAEPPCCTACTYSVPPLRCAGCHGHGPPAARRAAWKPHTARALWAGGGARREARASLPRARTTEIARDEARMARQLRTRKRLPRRVLRDVHASERDYRAPHPTRLSGASARLLL